MYEPPSSQDFNPHSETVEEEADQLASLLEKAEAENLSVKSIVTRQEELKRLFTWLVGLGIGLGVVVAIVIVIAIQKFGLAKKPYEVETEPLEPAIEQIQLDEDSSSQTLQVEEINPSE